MWVLLELIVQNYNMMLRLLIAGLCFFLVQRREERKEKAFITAVMEKRKAIFSSMNHVITAPSIEFLVDFS